MPTFFIIPRRKHLHIYQRITGTAYLPFGNKSSSRHSVLVRCLVTIRQFAEPQCRNALFHFAYDVRNRYRLVDIHPIHGDIPVVDRHTETILYAFQIRISRVIAVNIHPIGIRILQLPPSENECSRYNNQQTV